MDIKNKIVLEYNTINTKYLEKIIKENPKEIWSFQEEENLTNKLRIKYPIYQNNFVTTNLEKEINLLKENFDIIYIVNKIDENRLNKVLEIVSFYLKKDGLFYFYKDINTNNFKFIKKEQELYAFKKK